VRVFLATLVLIGGFLGPNFFRGSWESEAAAIEIEDRPRLVAAVFRSSWCSACRILEPRVEDVREDYLDAPVEFLRFDFTMGRRGTLRASAEDAGISELYDRLEGRTGFMVLMDRETGQIFEIVTIAYGRDEIRAALDRWLMVTERL
jgi:thiol-disulfide isomerase/thioredoxin